MNRKILFVDDDPNVLSGFRRNLRKEFEVDTCEGGDAALKQVGDMGPYAVLVADMQMPGMNGIEFLMRARNSVPDTVRIMLTGNADQKTARDAVNKGHIFQFLTKPCPLEDLVATLDTALKQYALVTAERELLERTLNGGVKMLTDVLSMLDPDAFGAGQRLRDRMGAFARTFSTNQVWALELAAMLSPIGWVSVPATLRQKVQQGHGLSGVERDILARIPEVGAELISNIPRLELVGDIIRYQNKNHDGSGFPLDKVCGDSIPIGARILRVLKDILDFETRRIPVHAALIQMKQRQGSYDPKVLDAVAAEMDVYLPAEGSLDTGVKMIGFNDLHVGLTLRAELLTKDGTLICPADTKVSPTLLAKLRNFAQLSGIKEPICVASDD